jgi:CHC2 zinc finger
MRGDTSQSPGLGSGAAARSTSGVDAPMITQTPFGPELSDLEARLRWLYRQPDLAYPDETRALLRLWLEDIAAERKRRERYNLTALAPAYGIPDDLKERLRADCDLVTLIGDDVPLRRMGKDWRGRCPLCHADNPSTLSVTNTSNPPFWHCHRCHEGGDVYTWLMLYQGVDFPGAGG